MVFKRVSRPVPFIPRDGTGRDRDGIFNMGRDCAYAAFLSISVTLFISPSSTLSSSSSSLLFLPLIPLLYALLLLLTPLPPAYPPPQAASSPLIPHIPAPVPPPRRKRTGSGLPAESADFPPDNFLPGRPGEDPVFVGADAGSATAPMGEARNCIGVTSVHLLLR